jgi:hypothetical protein
MADTMRNFSEALARVGRVAAMGLLVVAPLACAHRHGLDEGEQSGPAQLSVENQEFPDFDVFVVTDGGMRLRLGLATGHSTTTFEIPRSVVDGGSAHLHFIADPVGGQTPEVGELVIVNPGDQIQLTIAPY